MPPQPKNYAERIPLYNLADEQGRTVLMHAVLADNPAAVKLFVEDGSVTVVRPPGFRDYVIALASATDKDGHNALHLGAAQGKANALQALLHAFGDQADDGPWAHVAPPGPQERNTYVARTDKSGKTALKLAEDAGHTQTAAVLKRFGAK